jgi:hypothetical protein
MTAPKEILDLVERFDRNRDAYRSSQYNETQLRREYLDPFFGALGWDIDNKQGYAEAYKDVIHEDAIKIGGFTKAPDYCFRIGGARKFFVEAKKPAIDIRQDASPAFQLRRYAWSAKLPLSILTDFEEFALYDCRIKPANTDKASTGRIKFLTYAEYAENWDEIASIFSREAVLKGSFDKYAETSRSKKGTAEVDAAFLKEIESWRDLLARNLAVRNPVLSQRELNFAVQRTIDRIIFLRICEDRGIEIYGRLMALLNGPNVYARLLDLYRKADERYNSGLFHFREEKGRTEDVDRLTTGLAIDDKTLKEIIRNLYYPDSPYELSVLPADILGQVYEQFLGKVIRLTAGHQAKVEDKPEVKKAGGVFYTPTYIVEYIVRNTVGHLLEGKTPNEAASLKILDPACGSGSFLIGAYQRLLDWHRDWYVNNGKEKWAKGKEPALYQGPGGEWRLTTAKRKEILLNNIYGVDIDSQAVEVTKLSLLLKVLEGESDQSLTSQFMLFHQRALPDLGSNIKCGNSLIGSDFYQDQQLGFFDEEERLRINVFDWDKEFPKIFSGVNPGFDAVIGNPPYVRQESLGKQKTYFECTYKVYHGMADLYTYFIERGVSLLKNGGCFSYIVANKWIRANYGEPLRRWMKEQGIEEIIDFGDLPVFKGATTYPCIIRLTKGQASTKFSVIKVTTLIFENLDDYVHKHNHTVKRETLDHFGWSLADEKIQAILEKIKLTGNKLENIVNGKFYSGIKTGINEAFIFDAGTRERLIAEDPKSNRLIKPFLVGRDIKRYCVTHTGRFLILIPKGLTNAQSNGARDAWGWFQKSYPAVANHLLPFRSTAEKRFDKGDYWWELRACEYYMEFEKPKILWPEIAGSARFALDLDNSYANNKVFFLPDYSSYLLGLLNSSLLRMFIHSVCTDLQGDSFNFSGVFVMKTPIRTIDFSVPADKARHARMVQMVEQMLSLNKQMGAAKTSHEKTALQRQIDATDQQIDQLVYELYGLTDEEIRIVEVSTRKAV